MIDWHCHILPGVDDGATDSQKSLAMASELSAVGFTQVYCTPHLMRGIYEVCNEKIFEGVANLQEQLDQQRIQIKLRVGREYYLDEFIMEHLQEPVTMGDDRSVLIEIPNQATDSIVRSQLYSVVRSGLKPVIAHPERSHQLYPKRNGKRRSGFIDIVKNMFSGDSDEEGGIYQVNSLLNYLKELGCSFQGNYGSFNGFYGKHVQDVAELFKSLDVYDRYGTDLHAPEYAAKILEHNWRLFQ